jgi:CHAD domain-containing protein
MHNGKWIRELTAAMPLADAARRVLGIRLATVHRALPLAIEDARRDVEHVHQLRVATRRARAALDIFTDCLPDGEFRAAKKELRKIRRAAGAARDWDVFLAAVTDAKRRVTVRQTPGRDLLIGYAMAQRHAAQQQLAALGADYADRFETMQTETLAAVREQRPGQMLFPMAPALLTALIEALEQAMAGNLDDYAQLHQVRIAGKRLRYAMEIFVDCFPPQFRGKLYPAVEAMQEILGDANDSHVACGRLAEVIDQLAYVPTRSRKRLRTGLEWHQQYHEQRLRKQRALFDAWREQWRRLDKAAALTVPSMQRASAAPGCAGRG